MRICMIGRTVAACAMIFRSSLVLFVAVPALAFSMPGARQPKQLRHDAAVEAIMVPNADERYAAFNPAVHEPRIVLRNAGTDPLAAISIRYGTEGFLPRMFAWTGHLPSGASIEVKLTHIIDMVPGDNIFTVTLGDPNGRKDRNKANSTLSVHFQSADVISPDATVTWHADGRAGGHIELLNVRGTPVIDKHWKPTGRDTVMREEVRLTPGYYVLTLADSIGSGHSLARILGPKSELLKTIHGDRATVHQFRVEENPARPAPLTTDVTLLILEGKGQALLDAFISTDAEYRINDATGEVVLSGTLRGGSEQYTERIDLSRDAPGRYEVRVFQGDTDIFFGVIDVKSSAGR